MSECSCKDSFPPMDSAAVCARVDDFIAHYGTNSDACIPILQAVQKEFRHLPVEALERICRLTAITPAQITGVATFYGQFRHRGAGRHLIQVCHGTACHVAGAERVTESIRRHLQLENPEEDTSSDGLFTIERVACLGCCTLAPVMLIDGLPYGHLDSTKAIEAVEEFLRDEAAGLHAKGSGDALEAIAGTGGGVAEPVAELRIGLNSCCIASGSLEVRRALERAVDRTGAPVAIKPVGCTGMCHRVPLVEVVTPGGGSTLYAGNTPREAERLVARHVEPRGWWRRTRHAAEAVVRRLVDDDAWLRPEEDARIDPESGDAGAFLQDQVRIVTEHCGDLNPVDLDEYIATGGYEALRRVAGEMTPEAVIDAIGQAGLRGRGGAGYPTGDKIRRTREAPGERRYVVCNGDEGDPGAFMDRMLLEAFPHRIVEGLAILALAVGAEEGFLYIRAEYQLAVHRVETALRQAEERGFLGEGVCGSGRRLTLRVKQGAGAFVCGEETALLASIQGLRGMPRFRPPYPSARGLWDSPTLVNNTETCACVPWILRNGPEAFAAIGTPHSKGTKIFALAGKVRRGGLIEVPMGTTIRHIVEHIGGGAREGRRFKAVQLGGPSGGCIPATMSDVAVDYEAVKRTGAIMGSGGLVVLDDTDCMVDVARFFLDFTQRESCGRCTFCRIGTRRMLEILDRLCRGDGSSRDLTDLEELAHQVRDTSLCGLGKTAPNPILTTLRYFRDEYEAHVQGHCPAGRCVALVRYAVTDACIGCTLCAQQCPVDAIAPRPHERHEIDAAKCVRCGACARVCPESAIEVRPLKGDGA